LKMTTVSIAAVVQEARAAADTAARKFFQERLGGEDQYACGFAWVNIYGVRGNTRVGKELLKHGFRRPYGQSGLQMWNPSGLFVQNVDTLEAGAEAAAAVFKKYGFEAYAGSRLD